MSFLPDDDLNGKEEGRGHLGKEKQNPTDGTRYHLNDHLNLRGVGHAAGHPKQERDSTMPTEPMVFGFETD